MLVLPKYTKLKTLVTAGYELASVFLSDVFMVQISDNFRMAVTEEGAANPPFSTAKAGLMRPSKFSTEQPPAVFIAG